MAAGAGALSAGSGVTTRILSERGGPHDGHAPPARLLSSLIVVMGITFGLIALASRMSGLCFGARRRPWPWSPRLPLCAGLEPEPPPCLVAEPGWEWTNPIWPADWVEWDLILVHCGGALAAQLTLATGYATTRAGISAFIQLTELAWVYVLDVTLLGEPTTVLSTLGTAIVFASAVAAANISDLDESVRRASEEQP